MIVTWSHIEGHFRHNDILVFFWVYLAGGKKKFNQMFLAKKKHNLREANNQIWENLPMTSFSI